MTRLELMKKVNQARLEKKKIGQRAYWGKVRAKLWVLRSRGVKLSPKQEKLLKKAKVVGAGDS